jgi:hypothetical protein
MLVLNEEAAKHAMAPVPSHTLVLARCLQTYSFSSLSSLYTCSGLKTLVGIVCYYFFAQTSITRKHTYKKAGFVNVDLRGSW